MSVIAELFLVDMPAHVDSIIYARLIIFTIHNGHARLAAFSNTMTVN